MGSGIYRGLVLCLLWTVGCMAEWYWICSGLSKWMTRTGSKVGCRVYGGLVLGLYSGQLRIKMTNTGAVQYCRVLYTWSEVNCIFYGGLVLGL